MNSTEILQRFDSLPFQVEVELGKLSATIGDIFDLREGKVFRTDHPSGVPFKLRVGGIELATVEIVVLDKCVSARVSALVEGNGTS
jgi:flagellar motor switch/type III secretory pathway protein FliN